MTLPRRAPLFALALASSGLLFGCSDDSSAATSVGASGASGAGGAGSSASGVGGAGATSSSSVGAGGAGGGGLVVPGGELDPYVDVPATGPYGTHEVKVPAASNWVQTGLFLRAGQEVTLTATGSWSIDGSKFFGPAGNPGSIERGCPSNGLVARLGLHFEDPELYCIGDGATVVAPRDGIVYLASNFGTDLGECYGTRLDAAGSLDVTLTSTGDTVPTLAPSQLETYDFAAVTSGWVELRSDRTIVTIPAADALADRATAAASLDTLDAIYDTEAELRSAVPYRSQLVRFFPDKNIEDIGAYMLAGNPIRTVPDIMSGAPDQRILRASEEPTDVWGFSHELGHTFTFPNGTWVYMIVNLESWPNVFTLRALEQLNRTHPNKEGYCNGKAAYLASGVYDDVRTDPFLQLCFLMEFKEAYGWEFWTKFFVGMNATTNNDIPYDPNSDAATWGFVRDRFNDAAGEDTTSLFDTWRIPLPSSARLRAPAGPKGKLPATPVLVDPRN
jgi:hypothetical protein